MENFCIKFFTLHWTREYPFFICSSSVFTFTWYFVKSIPLTPSKSLNGFSLTEAGLNAFGSSSYISARPFLTLAYNLTLSVFGSQFLNSMELLSSCKHFMRLISLSSIHLKRAYEVVYFIFKKISKKFMRA